MNITRASCELAWRTNNKGVWKALVKDMTPDTEVVFSEGYAGAVTGRLVVVETASRPVGFITYESDMSNAVSGGLLYGVGVAQDTCEVIGGTHVVEVGNVDLSALVWTESGGTWTAVVADMASNTSNVLLSSGLPFVVSGTDIIVTSATAPYGVLYYELAAPVVSTEPAQSLAIEAGSNTLGCALFDLAYEGTEYSILLRAGCKYIHRNAQGVDAYLEPDSDILLAVQGGTHKVIDLSHWFDIGNEPDLAGFYALYPAWKNYDIPYLEGAILNYEGTGIRTVGFNAYDHATGTAQLLGGNKYQICGMYESCSYVDQWGVAETLGMDDDGIFMPSNNGTLTVVGGDDTSTCVHLVWSGYKNYGEPDYKYAPYTVDERVFPVAAYFPGGMNGFDDVFDELYVDKYIKKLNSYTFDGTETWTYADGVFSYRPSVNDKKAGLANFRCSRYPLAHAASSAMPDGTITGNAVEGIASSDLYVKDSRYADASEFAASMAGTTVVYELFNSVMTEIAEPLNLSYFVNDFGTEHSVPQNTEDLVTVDMHAFIRYSEDFTRLLINMSKIYSVLKYLAEHVDNIAMKDGTYQNMTVGNSYNMIDRNAPGTDRQFSYDTSGGNLNITDGTAVARKVMGTTLNPNQLVAPTNENRKESANGVIKVTDAVEVPVKHLTVSGDLVVTNQLVKEYVTKTVTGMGRIWVRDAVETAAKELVLTASESVVEASVVVGVTPSVIINGATTVVCPVPLYGIGTVRDSHALVSGVTIRRIGSVDMATMPWTESDGVYSAQLDDIKPDTLNVLTGNGYTVAVSGDTVEVTADAAPTGMLYYELAESFMENNTARTVALTSHDNTIFQPDNGNDIRLELTYDGLNQTVMLDPTHTYVFTHNFVMDYVITNETSIDCVGTEDMLVDVTMLYNGDATRIAKIHRWASLSTRIHMYRAWLPYDAGTITPLSAKVTVLKDEYAYGVVYDPSNTSTACQKVELHDGVITEVVAFSSLSAHDKFFRCVMPKLANRTIAYYLDDQDSTKKYNGTRNGISSDGTASVLTGADGDVMSEMDITHVYLDEDYQEAGKVLWLVSDKPFTGSEIHPYFYVGPNGDTARKQYVGSFRACVCDENGLPLNTTEGAYAQVQGTTTTRKARSIAGAVPWTQMTLAQLRDASARNGGSVANKLFHEYLFLMMLVEGANTDLQTAFSQGYSNGIRNDRFYNWRKAGRTNYGNGTGQTLANPDSQDMDNFYSIKVNNVDYDRAFNYDSNGYYAWSNNHNPSTQVLMYTTSATPAKLDTAYSDTAGTEAGSIASVNVKAENLRVIQFQYRGIENPFGEIWEFDEGMQKYQKATLESIKVNNVVYYLDRIKDGSGTKTAWTNAEGTVTYWTVALTPGNNSIAYTDAECTVDSGYKTTQMTFSHVDGELWTCTDTTAYTSTDQHTASNKVYDMRRHYWGVSGYIKTFDPRTFLPRITGDGAGAEKYLPDYHSNDNGSGSRVSYVGGYATFGSFDGLGYRYVNYGLGYGAVYLGGRPSA